ncbi:MAG: HAMP domain-containing histidine kinase, partial [Candidatus Pacearchaeota archaeon]|nr:HAMP domain-containing histidine kinase [Candidatus Pacearchaeota archaeon]
KHYSGLQWLLLNVMTQIEGRRFGFREKALRGRKPKSIEKKIDDLFDYTNVSNRLRNKLSKSKIPSSNQQYMLKLVNNELAEERKSKSEDIKKIRETIALYQGQATLGKITHVLLHEGRKHLKVINEVPPRLSKWVDSLIKSFDKDVKLKLEDRAKLLVESSKSLTHLFKRIEPLATTRRPSRKNLSLKNEVLNNFDIFEDDLAEKNVAVSIDISDSIEIYSTAFDIATVFANLIENSLFWVGLPDIDKREITVEADQSDSEIEIIYQDTGPGFQGANLELMFEPGFSMKPDGTGLGLALVGEALDRMNGGIRAIASDSGAFFVINIKGKSK